MKKLLPAGLILGYFAIVVLAFGGSEDKFIKKYAMMKIYESCFGAEVVKQIRREMKAACAKCAAYEMPQMAQPTERPLPTNIPPQETPHDTGNTLYPQQLFDQEKLNQAILAYRPNPFGAPQYRPYSPVSGFYPFNNPMYQTPLLYPAYQQAGQYSPYSFPMVAGQPYLGGNRMSRDLDVRSQLEALTSRMSGRVKNVTCVMQELGYLDDNLEPNYLKISDRINNLPVSEELRRDMLDGIQFCQQFSQCVPEIKKERAPLSRELIRPMFFFKCYKHKKLEACVMKDVREKYAGVADEDLDDDVEIRRQGRDQKLGEKDMDSLATDIYEFLYGSDTSLDLDNIL
ncbi:uncharacterized protein LOC123311795 [Coccinella septempunctata]|uniref:uncharacterized protein LOC123311795 n=1 Tax=Coccinella septempunctata TaxID=41139 RepID=UPI001D06E5F8|nr:uncharacterized protein LOC123311795 [Coccinella septempunctata]